MHSSMDPASVTTHPPSSTTITTFSSSSSSSNDLQPSQMPSSDTPQDQNQNQDQTTPKVGYLFGHPITHSLSPLVHSLVFTHLSLPYTYTLHDSTSIPSFLALARSPAFYGAAITMPHKVAIIPHLARLTPAAAAIGAVNTVFPRPDPRSGAAAPELVGANTDCVGIREALRQNISPQAYAACRGRPALVVGGGGTSRAAVYALTRWVGCAVVYMLNRDAGEVDAVIAECAGRGVGADIVHVSSLAHARELEPPAVIVSAIPDFAPVTEGEVLVRECLTAVLERGVAEGSARDGWDGRPAVVDASPGAVLREDACKPALLEMCYHPTPSTAITHLALSKGWMVIPGTEAMIWQGLEQDRYWTGRDVKEMPVEEVKRAVGEALEKAKLHV